jgi:hypothetical protein
MPSEGLVALRTAMHYLSALSKIGDFPAPAYLRDLLLFLWHVGPLCAIQTAQSRLVRYRALLLTAEMI